jgi:hypothetical protein
VNKQFNGIDKALATLENLFENCFFVTEVTQYSRYWFGTAASGFQTTALDYTEDPTTQPFDWAVHWLEGPTCTVD